MLALALFSCVRMRRLSLNQLVILCKVSRKSKRIKYLILTSLIKLLICSKAVLLKIETEKYFLTLKNQLRETLFRDSQRVKV